MAIFEKIIKIKEQGARQTENRLSSLVKTGLSIGAVTIAFKAFADQMKKASQAAAEQEKIFKGLETAVNLSGVSYKGNEKALKDLFATQQKYTKYGDTDSAQMLTRLIQLSGDYEGSVKALETAQDLASTGMFDMNTAARYVGMALAGNVEMLGRYIPELRAGSDGLKDLTTKAEKTEYAMKLLNEKFGGTARAELDTYAGQVRQLQNYIGDYREMIGDKLNPVLKVGAERLTEFFRRATETSLETTIRQLKEMGASAEQLQRLQTVSDLENYFSTYAQNIQKVERQYNNLGKAYGKDVLQVLGKDIEIRASATRGINEQFRLTEDLTDKTKEYNQSLATMAQMTSAPIDNFKELVVVTDKNKLTVENLDKAIGLLSKESIALGVNYKEATEKGRESIGKEISANAERIRALEELKNLLINISKEEEKFNGIVKGATDEQRISIERVNAELRNTKDAIEDISFDKFIKKLKYNEFINIFNDIKKEFESGLISEVEFRAKIKAISPEQIDESIIYPLKSIPEEDTAIDIDLRTDWQKFSSEYEKYIDEFGSAIKGVGQIWENVVESNYNKELKALKDTAKYQKATNDERKVMEEDLYNSFADEREKYSKYQKAAAIAEAIINTAAAVVEALPNYALAGLTAAAGITQIGIIASQPIPQYAEGGLLPSNQKLFIANESGQEAILNAETTARLGSSGVDTLNSGGSLGNVMYININNPLLLENQQIDLVADMIVKRARQGFNDLEVRY